MSYKNVEDLLGLSEPLPITEDWSAAADFLKLISEYCLEQKPEIIIECSSGATSLVLARCCEINGEGKVYSLENGKSYAENTRQKLNEFSLSRYCEVIYSPLETIMVNGESYQWYGIDKLKNTAIDLLVIDGPPGFIQKNSRYPALPLLGSNLSNKCSVFLDDAARDDEKEIIQQWLKLFPDFDYKYLDNERGCAVLSRG